MNIIIRSALAIGLMACVSSTAAMAADAYAPEPVVSASSFYIRGDAGWSWLSTKDNDNSVAVIGGGVGYRFTPNLRADVRGDYAGLGSSDHYLGTVLGNLYFDIPTQTIFTPYVGAGLGYGWSDSNGDNRNGGAFAAMAGVEINLTDNLSADVGYRYRQIFSEDVYDNEALVGLRYSF